MPRQRGERQRGEREKRQQEPAGLPDALGDPARGEAGEQSGEPGGETPLQKRRVERGRRHVRDDADGERREQREPAEQHGGALHIESGDSVEPGQREAQAEQREAHRAAAQDPPERLAQEAAHRPGRHRRHERQPDEDAEHQRGERAEPAAILPPHETSAGGSAGAAVIRRSWKIGSTG